MRLFKRKKEQEEPKKFETIRLDGDDLDLITSRPLFLTQLLKFVGLVERLYSIGGFKGPTHNNTASTGINNYVVVVKTPCRGATFWSEMRVIKGRQRLFGVVMNKESISVFYDYGDFLSDVKELDVLIARVEYSISTRQKRREEQETITTKEHKEKMTSLKEKLDDQHVR